MDYPEKIQLAVEALSSIPGIGEKTALRYALEMCNWEDGRFGHLANSISKLGEIDYCPECFFFSEGGLCKVCKVQNEQSPRHFVW